MEAVMKNRLIVAASTAAIIAMTSPAITQEEVSEIGLDKLQDRVAALEAAVASLSQSSVDGNHSEKAVGGNVDYQESTITEAREWCVCGAAGKCWRIGHPDC